MPEVVDLSFSNILLTILLLVALVLVFLLARLPKQLQRAHDLFASDSFRESSASFNSLADRLSQNQASLNENLRALLSQELTQLRSTTGEFQLKQIEEQSVSKEKTLASIAEMRSEISAKQEAMRLEAISKILEKLTEQSRAERELLQSSLKNATSQLNSSMEQLSKTTDSRLEQISGKVNERLEEGFKKTNETFLSVMERLATIDEAQKKIDGLTSNVVGLQELLGDKRSRGAFGEVQLEGLVKNMLPPGSFDFQFTLSNGNRVDCVLRLPAPTGMVGVDSKFPLENYHRMFDKDVADVDKLQAQKAFKADIRRHVDDISNKYIIDGETSDGAVMFIPAEAVFAEIHA